MRLNLTVVLLFAALAPLAACTSSEPITLEYLGSRLNLTLDDRDIVQSLYCG